MPLSSRVPKLKERLFYKSLGTMEDKVTRLQALAVELARYVPGDHAEAVRSAAFLAKADLSTGMVGEFPELQGVMGRYYALHDGEERAVADAIAEHYSPLGPNDRCPTAPVSVALALADKIDSLVGFFAIGETPTGSKDPFALRRAALGVIRLVIENELRVPLGMLTIFNRAFDASWERKCGLGSITGPAMPHWCSDTPRVLRRPPESSSARKRRASRFDHGGIHPWG